jgi:hypothetical protein
MRNSFVIAAFLAFVAGGAMASAERSAKQRDQLVDQGGRGARQGAQQLHRRRSEIADRESRIFEYQRAEEGR